MIKTIQHLPDFETFSPLLSCVPENSLFLDIETTGFSPASTSLYLIGAIWQEDGAWNLGQWLAENSGEESAILAEFLDLAARFRTLVHFNGNTFDLPYLKEKAAKYALADTLSQKESLDLYQTFRPLKRILGLEHMNQASLQSYLGLGRSDPLDGKALIAVYHKYASALDPELSRLLLLHNYEDLAGMTGLLALAAYFPLLNGDAVVTACHLKERSAVLTLGLHFALPQNIHLETDAGVRLVTDTIRATLEIPAFRGELCCFFPNYRDYYYLPLEGQAIHKSVAAYVDKAHRTAARPENCCAKKQGTFLLQPGEIIRPVFRKEYKSRELYFEYTEKMAAEPELLHEVAAAFLRAL